MSSEPEDADARMQQLLHRAQESARSMSCERAEFSLERNEMDLRISEMESKVRLQHQLNQNLFRRVQMLEQVLHQERHARAAGAAGAPPPVPHSLAEGLPGHAALEAALRHRRGAASAREILQLCLQGGSTLDNAERGAADVAGAAAKNRGSGGGSSGETEARDPLARLQ